MNSYYYILFLKHNTDAIKQVSINYTFSLLK